MIETPSSMDAQLSEIRDTLALILTEIKGLRRDRIGADEADVEALLAAIYFFYPDTPFTVSWLLEYAIDPDEDSVILRKTITAVI